MATIELLNNVTHKNLKVRAGYGAEFGDEVNGVVVFPTEFSMLQKEYPIFFQQHPETHRFQSVVLLGLMLGENLFVQGGGWQASYVPAIVERGPFLIGFQDQSGMGGAERAPVVYVDMDHPRVNEQEGEAVFLEYGGNSRYLDKMSLLLEAIYTGGRESEAMFAAFNVLGLIEPVNLEIELINREKYRLTGNHTISREKLAALSGSDLERLNKAGWLEAAFYVAGSINNVKHLIDRKNAWLLAQ